MNYLVVYVSKYTNTPISIFIPKEYCGDYTLSCEEDIAKLVEDYCSPDGIVCKKTLLDYDSYVEDQDNLIKGMLEVLYEN